MTLNYDETDDFDEADDFDETDGFDETDNFDEESEEEFLEEDDENPNTALSQAFREATAETIEDYDDTEDDESEEEDDDDESEEEEDADADTADADVDADTYAQRLVEPIDPLPDEEDLEDLEDLDVELPPLKLPSPEVEPFRPQEQSNFAYAEAVTAFYEEKNYQRAIEKFGEAIEYEIRHTEAKMGDSNEVVAKSKYWQAEAYIKLHDLPQAVGTLEDLVKTCKGHYLVLAAQRRADALNTKDS